MSLTTAHGPCVASKAVGATAARHNEPILKKKKKKKRAVKKKREKNLKNIRENIYRGRMPAGLATVTAARGLFTL